MSPENKDRVISVTLGVAAIFFTALAFASSIFGGKEGENQRYWILAGVISSAIAVYVGNSERVRLSAYRDKMKRLATQAERNYENLVANLAPSAAQAAVIADRTLPSGEQGVRRGRLDQSIAVGVSEIGEGARGIFYSWDSTTRVFKLVSQWPASAIPEIDSGESAYSALELIAKDGMVLVRGNTASPFNRTTPSTPDERVAVVQVKVNKTVIGILAMDGKMPPFAPGSGFTDRDVRELLLYADLLAAALGAD
ncbi:GAF domain-containing protein [Streptomyces sp. NPDC127051]|uniref:GAF domain-containing protein n=1 Tax=Streptomyces sp. NPDC127051 TaxID=3347119 RepID=UPI003647857E